jgi:hypothetical protein
MAILVPPAVTVAIPQVPAHNGLLTVPGTASRVRKPSETTGGLIHRSLRDLPLKRQGDALAINSVTVNLLLTVKRPNPLSGTYPLGSNLACLKMD